MTYRKTLMGLVSSIAIMAALPSMAQTSNSSSSSTSGANSGSSSSSRAQGGGATGNRSNQTATQGIASTTNTGVTLNQTSNSPASTSASNTDRLAGGTSNSNQNTNSGYTSSDNIVRTTPTVYAPPVSGGNPCTLAVSGGVSVIGWGAAAGGTFVDEDCANRQKIAMIHNAGYAQAARELMCNDKATYYAFRGTATPCAPRPQFDGAAAPAPVPMVQQAPTPVVYTPPPSAVIKNASNLPRCSRTITDNCYAG